MVTDGSMTNSIDGTVFQCQHSCGGAAEEEGDEEEGREEGKFDLVPLLKNSCSRYQGSCTNIAC